MKNTKGPKSKARSRQSDSTRKVSDIMMRLIRQVLVCVSLDYISTEYALKLILINDDDEAVRARDKLNRRVDRIQAPLFAVHSTHPAAKENELPVSDIGGQMGSGGGDQPGNQAGAGV